MPLTDVAQIFTRPTTADRKHVQNIRDLWRRGGDALTIDPPPPPPSPPPLSLLLPTPERIFSGTFHRKKEWGFSQRYEYCLPRYSGLRDLHFFSNFIREIFLNLCIPTTIYVQRTLIPGTRANMIRI